MELSDREFELLREYIHKICGLTIPDNKAYLIHQRLEPLVKASGCRSFHEFHEKIRQSYSSILNEQIISAITTNETSFFRDGHPFTAFKEYILPKLARGIQQRKAWLKPAIKTRLWSAAASTGQEPYSIAMLIHEYISDNKHPGISCEDFEILATDISSKAISKAISGEYTELEIKRGLSSEIMAKYFKKTGANQVIKSSIQDMIKFRQINLTRPFTVLGGFDVIFCRNVLIYFDKDTVFRIINQFCNLLSDDGFLILGATENLYAVTDKFDSVRYGDTIIFKKQDKP
ncbi:MAG: protein-glutamate O-methyltransferase CheR [Desulfobacteraceae bacterium]|nr:protein-glutamate O-methyltransferase CheR [Desulfobacteraceae bacterium]